MQRLGGVELPFLPDGNGVCILTGITKYDLTQHGQDESHPFPGNRAAPVGTDKSVLRRKSIGSYDSYESVGDSRAESVGFSKPRVRNPWSISKIEPSIGSRLGFQPVVIYGSFPLVTDPSLVYVNFGDRLQRPLRWSTSCVECYSIPVGKEVSQVIVSLSFDGGNLFTSETVKFSYTDVNYAQWGRPGSHVYHWGNTGSFLDRDAFIAHLNALGQKVKNKGRAGMSHPAWIQTKYPSLREGQAMILGDFCRKYLNISDVGVVEEFLSDCENNGVKALDRLATSSLAAAETESEGRLDEAGSTRVVEGFKTELDAFCRFGMPIKQLKCAENMILVLLEDGRMVVQAPPSQGDEPSFGEWVTIANTVEAPQPTAVPSSASMSNRRRQAFSVGQVAKKREENVRVVALAQDETNEEALDSWFFQQKTKGQGGMGEPKPPVYVFPKLEKVAIVAAGRAHFCAVTDEMCGAQLFTWGDNSYGQLGNGNVLETLDLTGIDASAAYSGPVFSFGPTRVDLHLSGTPGFSAVKQVCCGPNSTIIAAMDTFGKTAIFSWGASSSIDPAAYHASGQSKNELRASSLPHKVNQDVPFHALTLKPTEKMTEVGEKKFWTESLENWLLATEDNWSTKASGNSLDQQTNNDQEQVQHLNSLADVLERHFRIKFAYIDDLENILDQTGTIRQAALDDMALGEVQALRQSIGLCIELLNRNLEELRMQQIANMVEIRKIHIAESHKRSELLELSERASNAQGLTAAQTEPQEQPHSEGKNVQPSKKSSARRGSVKIRDTFFNKLKGQFRRGSTANQAEEGKDEDQNRVSSRSDVNVSSAAAVAQNEKGQKPPESETHYVLRRIHALTDEIERIEKHRNAVLGDVERDNALADDILMLLSQMEKSEKLFDELVTDWQIETDSLPLEETSFSDDFDIVLELLADIQACSITTLAAQSYQASAVHPALTSTSSTQASGSNQGFFARPGSMVRESQVLPQQQVDIENAHGFDKLIKKMEVNVTSIQEAVHGFGETDQASECLIEMTNDMCQLKKMNLKGLRSLVNETDRLLGIHLATTFETTNFDHVPKHPDKVISPLM